MCSRGRNREPGDTWSSLCSLPSAWPASVTCATFQQAYGEQTARTIRNAHERHPRCAPRSACATTLTCPWIFGPFAGSTRGGGGLAEDGLGPLVLGESLWPVIAAMTARFDATKRGDRIGHQPVHTDRSGLHLTGDPQAALGI